MSARLTAGLIVFGAIVTFPATSALGTWADDPPGPPEDTVPIKIETAKDRAKSREARGGSPQDSDAPSVDWDSLPSWRRTEFYGVRAEGQFFVYVVDRSGSMGQGTRMLRAKHELRTSIERMQFPQKFLVIFYNEEPWAMTAGVPKSADLAAKRQLTAWMRFMTPEGRTRPTRAVEMALDLRPDAIFLVSDGEYPKGTVEAIDQANSGKVPIHCVDLSGGSAGVDLQRIASDSGGQYVSRP